jgi:phosphoribosylglycinamide formyltransferase-1
MKTADLGVLVSGRSRGSNFAAMLRAIEAGDLHARVGLLVATNAEHGAIEKAQQAGVKTLVLPPASLERDEWEHQVADALYEEGVSILALAGFLRHIGPTLLDAFPRRILNVHPSLLPAFGGQGMYGLKVHRAVLEHGCKVTGCTVHFVNEHYDMGRIVAQAAVPVEDNDTPGTLSARVQAQEHRLFPQCLEWLIQNQLRFEGRRVRRVTPKS